MGSFSRFSTAATGLLCAASLGCAGIINLEQGGRYRYFTQPVPASDPWYGKVENWQTREQRDRPNEALANAEGIQQAGPRSGLLRVKMGRWTAEERLSMAKRIAGWAQEESRRHYRFDPPTDYADDPWPTTKDLLDQNGHQSFDEARGSMNLAACDDTRAVERANYLETLKSWAG